MDENKKVRRETEDDIVINRMWEYIETDPDPMRIGIDDEPGQRLQLGCQKLSFEMIEMMAASELTRVEVNAIVQLAKRQDEEGHVLINAHVLCRAIHCSPSYFTRILRSLASKGLISIQRTGDRRTDKYAPYIVTLLYNNFSGKDLKKYPYVRLSHKIFDTDRFLVMRPAAKYMIFGLIYALHHNTKLDFSNTKKNQTPAIVLKEEFIKKIMYHTGYNRHCCMEALREIKRIAKVKSGIAITRKMQKNLQVTFAIDDLRMEQSDDFVFMSNILEVFFAENGSKMYELLEEMGLLDEMAGLIYRFEKRAKKDVVELKALQKELRMIWVSMYSAMENYKRSRTKENKQQIHEENVKYEKVLTKKNKIEDRMKVYPENIAVMKSEQDLVKWNFKEFKDHSGIYAKLPIWFRQVASILFTASRWVEKFAKYRKEDLRQFNLTAVIGDFASCLFFNKTLPEQYVYRRFYAAKKKAEAAA